MLNGRNHHSNGMACITEGSTGYPGSNGAIPFENGFLSEMLLPHGYATFCVGKWHLTPAEQISAAGPYTRWPLGRGFDRYYGFLGGDTHQYYPDLVFDNHQVEPPKTPEEGYHLTVDLADKAIEFVADLKQVAPEKPFFLYFATGANHAPHQVPKEWADKYKGKFDDGWDAYREKVFARQKELGIVARGRGALATRPRRAAVERTLRRRTPALRPHDGGLRRLLRAHRPPDRSPARLPGGDRPARQHAGHGHLRQRSQRRRAGRTARSTRTSSSTTCPTTCSRTWTALDDLGGPKYFNHYPWGWTFAGNTPFRRWKRETYRGGVSDPFLVHWPKGIEARGEIRRQYAHAIDMVPTVLESLGIEAPTELRGVAQSPIEGVSFAHSFNDASAPTKHHTQYFEMFAHRSIYHDGWRAVCPFPGTSFAEAGVSFGMLELTEDKLRELDATGWELYNVEADPAETNDLAEQERAKLIEMIALWYTEAGKYNVLPLDSRGTMRFADERPQIASARDTYVYFPGTQAVPENVAAKVLNRAHTITVDAELSEGDEGVLACHGSNVGGYVLFVQDGKLHYVHNYVGAEELRVSSNQPVPPGKHALSYEFAPTGPPDLKNGKGTPGVAKLLVDGEPVGQTDFPVTVPLALGLGSGFAVGRNPGSPVSVMYTSPFPFTGTDHEGDRRCIREARPRRGRSKEVTSASRDGTAINSQFEAVGQIVEERHRRPRREGSHRKTIRLEGRAELGARATADSRP